MLEQTLLTEAYEEYIKAKEKLQRVKYEQFPFGTVVTVDVHGDGNEEQAIVTFACWHSSVFSIALSMQGKTIDKCDIRSITGIVDDRSEMDGWIRDKLDRLWPEHKPE